MAWIVEYMMIMAGVVAASMALVGYLMMREGDR